MKKKLQRVFGLMLLTVFTFVYFSTPVQNLAHTPDIIYYDSEEQISALENSFSGSLLSVGKNTAVAGSHDERYAAEISLFGVVPIKKVRFVEKKQVTLIPCGHSVGISILTRGLLVVDTADVFIDANGTEVKSPAYKAGVRPGDIILYANGTEVNTTDDLLAACAPLTELIVNRDGNERRFTIEPVTDTRTGQLRLGMWVREDTAGVGTMSFYDAQTGIFAALGHAVTDADTGTASDVKSGVVCRCDIVNAKKGKAGQPGELIGVFSQDVGIYGTLTDNTEFGVFGEELDTDEITFTYPQGLSLAYPDEVHTGDAKILCCVSGCEPHEYSCKIIKCQSQDKPAVKGLVIEITDEGLIEKTGGIVQGMSGSPIIQDNKIAGVVTHVMINNPLRGYGIYAYWMAESERPATGD